MKGNFPCVNTAKIQLGREPVYNYVALYITLLNPPFPYVMLRNDI